MARIWKFLTDTRVLAVIGIAALAAILMIGAAVLGVGLLWAAIVGLVLLACWGIWWMLRRAWRARKARQLLAAMAEGDASLEADGRGEVAVLRKNLLEAVSTIKTSKLGLTRGAAALYELPWYMIIGNPAAGKSSAIVHSGLTFPIPGNKALQGVGGTRNCDWFFTTDGILLDTAGRYSVNEEDRAEWLGFLDLLKKYRKRAPINGIIIAVSIAELTGNRPEFAINLAKNLRQRVQELTERLEVHAPVYVVFTKADLITGFNEFFQDAERGDRDKVWGATLPYSQNSSKEDVLQQFDARFDELYDGLKELSMANMALQWRQNMPPGVFTFPLEFSSIKGSLRTFIATLFEENPFQFKPVFRGFYFTSAVQEGETVSASSERVAHRFDLQLAPTSQSQVQEQHGYFLLNLFRKVIFADKDLVAQYASPAKMRARYVTFFAVVALAGLALGGWSWSYLANRQLVANVQADLDQAIKVQEQKLDLASRFEALEILQDRIEQLDAYRDDRPLALGLGLYQGEMLEQKLRQEYFAGLKEVMLKPVGQSLEAFLGEVNSGAAQLQPMTTPPQSGATGIAPAGGVSAPNTAQASVVPGLPAATTNSAGPLPAAAVNFGALQFKDANPGNVEDAYNALKTYLMLSDKSRAEASHLNDQLTRFWRVWLDSNRGTMTREQMIRSAERMISFYLSQMDDPAWPTIEGKLALVDQTRDNLRRVVRGMPARERVYADVKARAATRFASMTVARVVGDADKELVVGSYAIPGTFTREAWSSYIQGAFRDAANRELQSTDWVLKTAASDDLTLEGSPEQIQKALLELYKNEYAQQWQRFIQGVSIRDLNGFDGAAAAMNRLGDPESSPIDKLIKTVYEETSWDNPSLVDAGLQQAQRGMIGWFKETILRRKPAVVEVKMDNSNKNAAAIPMGPVGREFSDVARLVVSRDQGATLMKGYMDMLSKLRARFNQIKNQGDTGPGAKQFMQQTLDGSGSELADALKYVDEQMLIGMTDAQKQAIRPLLVRPLMQTFSVIVRPTEAEINKVWAAQVLEPFNRTLALKYPFAGEAAVEATDAEIGQIFGPEGAIAKYFNTTIGPLVVRRGDVISAKTWANMGINLAPGVISSFPSWIAPLSAGGVAANAGAGEAQTRFDVQALGATGATEFTIEIDGQALRWRGQPQPFVQMVWPNPRGVPGSRITGITPEGRTVVLLNEPGHFGLKKMIDAAKRTRRDNGVFELSWENSGVVVRANLKIVGTTKAAAPPPGAAAGFRRMRLPEVVAVSAPPTPASATAAVATTTTAGAGAPAGSKP